MQTRFFVTAARLVSALVVTLILAACGNKGSLTLPPRPEAAKPPAPAAPAAKPAPDVGKDLSSSPSPAAQ